MTSVLRSVQETTKAELAKAKKMVGSLERKAKSTKSASQNQPGAQDACSSDGLPTPTTPSPPDSPTNPGASEGQEKGHNSGARSFRDFVERHSPVKVRKRQAQP
jgi:hypothetical protein